MFHYGQMRIGEAKSALRAAGLPVRPVQGSAPKLATPTAGVA